VADPASDEARDLAELIADQATALDLGRAPAQAGAQGNEGAAGNTGLLLSQENAWIADLAARLYEIERELIPQGLHVAG
jgi:magnesium chelatase subunit H